MESAPGGDPGQAEQATLRDLCREFPQFAIWREVLPDRTRYNARRVATGSGLHSVITADMDEMRAVLTQAAREQRFAPAWSMCGTGGLAARPSASDGGPGPPPGSSPRSPANPA